ncbi:cystathionine gamma-synthase [Bacillus canaveralius]|uniref:homocysteine desulfhydrase n=1 Tax=Bacillus canaveralius TaxID=1403243 RepID=A0A2N5GG23_9BACI|nr:MULTISPECIES: aminotransferase class I/II-fold pyridoxal phosphate-dependent enzyme [Bacillus]PLR79692.1 cystathionine gamma-synthase [Bacillus canaveralius]PLR87121.1 cystathionine gamma-synthase [Bacillus sp. V33-4]PLR91992.1 cystathionine gamma-synthase [Bacillus canaveralius]RSK50703.1 aminotransferase class I/II-fold pyridoxal phosphate-dependent enzyme [Bacillus canaveralius]
MGEKFETEVLHSRKKQKREIKSKVTPIYQTSAFKFDNLEELEGYYQGEGNYLYSRVGNPNTDELGEAVAALEGAPAGVASSSGLSAILAGVLSVARSGDHIVATDDLYGGSYHLLKEELHELGIETTFTSFSDLKSVEEAIRENTVLLYTESITNPLLRVEKLEAIVELAKKYDLFTLVDNTFATPYHCKPFILGIDLVVHSATKYIGGHSDITAGVLVGREELISKARAKIVNLGANLSPFEAWLTCRGLKTLAVRMKTQSENAKRLAEAMQNHQFVAKTYYPFSANPENFGAMVTIELDKHVDVSEFFRSLTWVKIVPTLAGVETTVSHPLKTSHRALPPETCAELGITNEVVRISVGIEHYEDIIVEFENAIKKALN